MDDYKKTQLQTNTLRLHKHKSPLKNISTLNPEIYKMDKISLPRVYPGNVTPVQHMKIT